MGDKMSLTRYLLISLVALLITVVLLPCVPSAVRAAAALDKAGSGSPLDTDAEYCNGSFPIEPVGSIWYAWINTSETQVIYYVLFSDQFNSPIMNFVGQRFNVGNDTGVFVGSTLAMIEVYDDANGDGIPQANFTSGVSEIVYHMLVNSSVSYEIAPIEKIVDDGTVHYRWGFRYDGIDGFLLFLDQRPSYGCRLMIDHMGFYYDFCVVEGVSTLKTSFDIGSVSQIEPGPWETSLSLENLSLSLLFSTVTIADESYSAYVNGQAYNSTAAANPATAINASQIAVENLKAYEFLFGETYNLTRNDEIETYDVKSEAAATTSVSSEALSRFDWTFAYFENNLNITGMFNATKGHIDLKCNASTLLYRVCYPVWDGLPIQHDPTYVAYLFSSVEIPEFPSALLPSLFVAALLAMIIASKRKRRFQMHGVQH
jgi:hypothetical protein